MDYLKSTRSRSSLLRTKTDLIQRMNNETIEEKSNNVETTKMLKTDKNFKKDKTEFVVD